MTASIGLALGGGSARGLAHILVLEVVDELGVKPKMIAGTSIGAIMGGQYAAGLSGKEIRAYMEELCRTRAEVFRRLSFSLDDLSALWSARSPSVIDGVTLFEMLLPPAVRTSFDTLAIPFVAVTTDYEQMSEHRVTHGPLIPAIAASAALPTILRPVTIEGRVLVDGGFVNPTPFDVVAPHADITIGVDVTGVTRARKPGEILGPLEAWTGSTQIMFASIVREKARVTPPDLLVRPAVGMFSTLEFHRYAEIFAAAQPAVDEMKRNLARLIESKTKRDVR